MIKTFLSEVWAGDGDDENIIMFAVMLGIIIRIFGFVMIPVVMF